MAYSYPTPNAQLIRELKLIKHPEGGESYMLGKQTEQVPTPFVDGTPPRSLATAIYYLLTHEDDRGFFHMNKSVTYHVLHQGRAEYTLIHPPSSDSPSSPPRVEKVVMGTDIAKGETRQLLVGTGVWKMSKIPTEDVKSAQTPEEKERVGCLITEVVTPGFHWEDHKFLTKAALKELFQAAPEKVGEFQSSVKE